MSHLLSFISLNQIYLKFKFEEKKEAIAQNFYFYFLASRISNKNDQKLKGDFQKFLNPIIDYLNSLFCEIKLNAHDYSYLIVLN